MKVTTIGLDIAKRVFQVHGVDDQALWLCGEDSNETKWLRSLRTCRRAR